MSNIPTYSKHDLGMKIAYIHAMSFPSPEANTFNAIWTASAFSERADTTFFMPRLKTSKSELKNWYEIPRSPLRLQSMYLDYLPGRLILRFRNCYEQFLSLYFRFHPQWAGFHGQKILYVREPKELLFWGVQRKHQKWLKDWIFFYEAHEPFGLVSNQLQGANPFELRDGPEGRYRQEILQALLIFDVVICNTKVLADDLKTWTDNAVRAHVIRHASPMPRLSSPPRIHSFGERIVLGYIGTIDQYRGVHILLEAMRLLPQKYNLRLVGRFRQEKGVNPDWLNKCKEDPQLNDRIEIKIEIPIRDVAAEIDCCDIVVQPASSDIIASRYSTPLKSFGYMLRGKPIVAADVPCHRELFQEGKNAVLYHLDPQSLADCVINLVNNPALAERIAQGAWEQAADFNLPRRAENILSLVKGIAK